MTSSMMKATVCWNDGTSTEMTAVKKSGCWFIGGDRAVSVTDLGAKVLVESKGKIYLLQGNRLIFQDFVGKTD